MDSVMQENIVGVRAGQRSLETIARQKLDLLKKENPKANAIVEYHPEELLREARETDKRLAAGIELPLAGAIMTVKDNLNVKGMKSTAGLEKYKDNIAGTDSRVVRDLKEAGALILGKSNMPPGAMDAQTDNPVYGRTNHPRFPERTCGGSSGGGACAVSLGISDMDIGNDLLGSIRIPAGLCGVYGFVPTSGSICLDGFTGGALMGSTLSQILRIGLQASTLADIRYVLPFIDNKCRSVSSETAGTPFKIAWSDDCSGLPLANEVRQCFARFRQKQADAYELYQLQAQDYDFDKARLSFLKILYGTIAANLPLPVLFLEKHIMRNRFIDNRLKNYFQAEHDRDDCTLQLEALFQTYDCLITPVSATPAFLHQKPDRMHGNQPIYTSFDVDGKKTNYATANLGYTTPFCTGHPVIVMPIGETGAGLPVGLQVVCAYHQENKLFDIVDKLQKQLQ